jgi:glucosamine--fructose-6-phosphate aminotransferase (isomerizing)
MRLRPECRTVGCVCSSDADRHLCAAEVYLFPSSILARGRETLAVLISRSGKTTEVILALDYLRGKGVRTLAITSTPDSPLATGSDLSLGLTPLQEQAVATTRSLTGMILTTQLVAAIVSDDQAYLDELCSLPKHCESQMRSLQELGRAVGQRTDLTKYAFVGNGPFFGLARECQLKVKEMVLLPVDAYPVLDFRHGPQSNVDANMLVVALISDTAQQEETQFLREMKAFGGVIWALCDQAGDELRACADYLLESKSGLGEFARGVLHMPAVQYMAYYRSLSRGFNPDKPHNLPYWVDTSK